MEISPEFQKMIDAAKTGDKARARTTPGFKVAPTIIRITGREKQVAQAIRDAAKGKKVRHVFIEATFPELKGGIANQSAHGEASGTKPAIARAFKNLLKTIPKRRISVIKATISITTKTVEDTNV